MSESNENLYHVFGDPMQLFFSRIKELGGWPNDKKYVVLVHSLERKRPCYFSNSRISDAWKTVMYDISDYYLWEAENSEHSGKGDKQ